ncbi:hypothetical protein, partial [Actinoplanes sp. NPDC051851]|uniref:hypothetical protein n=1 Tax=Actinoplanes sp. NPDC051851 TaxID=3154753 RepID=UPI00344A410A
MTTPPPGGIPRPSRTRLLVALIVLVVGLAVSAGLARRYYQHRMRADAAIIAAEARASLPACAGLFADGRVVD